MDKKIVEIENKILNNKGITKEEVIECQQIQSSPEELFHTYWIMSRYYLDRNQEDALTYCILKCYELNEQHQFNLEYKIKDFLEVRSSFIDEAIQKTRTKLLPLSILFGIIVLVAIWLILGQIDFIAFIFGFIAMNIVSIKFQDIASKKTMTLFKKKQYEAVYPFLDDIDKQFVDEH